MSLGETIRNQLREHHVTLFVDLSEKPGQVQRSCDAAANAIVEKIAQELERRCIGSGGYAAEIVRQKFLGGEP
jgi:hypothetical protein